MALRHLPERTCVACRLAQPKRNLVRIVRPRDGAVKVDLTGKLSGRGAYLCRQSSCWHAALKKDILGRALKRTLEAADRAALEAYAATLPATLPESAVGQDGEGTGT